METSNLKNMMVLKNVPSNMVEEAIIVLKKNIKVNEIEMQNHIENEANNVKKVNSKENLKPKDYVVKEAEMIVSHYMTKLENNKKKEILSRKMNQKYEKMKKYLFITSFMSIVEMFFLFIK